MKKLQFRFIITLSIAIFSMFFGAGNMVYPIALAIKTQNQFSWAFVGFAMTAIAGPLLGLIGGILFKGNTIEFFKVAGKFKYLFIGASLTLLGPFAVLPRCLSVSFGAMHTIFPSCPLGAFAMGFCALALLCCMKKKALLPILGYILSPTLIICLLLIIYKGFTTSKSFLPSSLMDMKGAFVYGLASGYETMDLIASIIFSVGIWGMVSSAMQASSKNIIKTTLLSGLLASLLLGFIYYGIGHVAALHSPSLAGISAQHLMSQLAQITLGPSLAIVANLAIILACFTTVIGLAMAISEVTSKVIFKGSISYFQTLSLLYAITFFMSKVGFEAISVLIINALTILYPLIIAITLINIFLKVAQRKRARSSF